MSKLLFCFLLLLINNAYSQIIIEGCVVDNTPDFRAGTPKLKIK